MKRKPKRPIDYFDEDQFGFTYGNIQVERVCKHPKFGNVIRVWGRDRYIDIRTTPSGRLRVEEQ